MTVEFRLEVPRTNDLSIWSNYSTRDLFQITINKANTSPHKTESIPISGDALIDAIVLGVISSATYDGIKALIGFISNQIGNLQITEAAQLIVDDEVPPIQIHGSMTESDVNSVTNKIIQVLENKN